jgi:RecA/RadA recombinase
VKAKLAGTIARLDERFGAHAIRTVAAAERQQAERRILTETSFDRIAGGLAPGVPCALVGATSSGKISLALRVAASAQREGGMAAWVDPVASFDPLAAARARVDLARVIVFRTRTREQALLAASAALRSGGFRLVVVDTGPSFARAFAAADLGPVLSSIRGSTAALLLLMEERGRRLAVPTYTVERAAWERRFGRTAGWVFLVRAARGGDAALFRVGFGGSIDLIDLGTRSGFAELELAV